VHKATAARIQLAGCRTVGGTGNYGALPSWRLKGMELRVAFAQDVVDFGTNAVQHYSGNAIDPKRDDDT
jgi:hypothetical protein